MPHQIRALVVDDDVNILSAFEDFFRREHCAMLSAANTQEALHVLSETEVNLVITDIRSPAESGLALCRRLKQDRPHLPIIAITGSPHIVAEKDVRSAGADHFFLKPLELDVLRGAVRKCLRMASSTNLKGR